MCTTTIKKYFFMMMPSYIYLLWDLIFIIDQSEIEIGMKNTKRVLFDWSIHFSNTLLCDTIGCSVFQRKPENYISSRKYIIGHHLIDHESFLTKSCVTKVLQHLEIIHFLVSSTCKCYVWILFKFINLGKYQATSMIW